MHNDRPPQGKGPRRRRIPPEQENLQFVGQEGRDTLPSWGPVAEAPCA